MQKFIQISLAFVTGIFLAVMIFGFYYVKGMNAKIEQNTINHVQLVQELQKAFNQKTPQQEMSVQQ